MRCTLLNSLERHLAPLCRGLTSLCEPAKHQTRSLIWQWLWLMILAKKWEETTKEGKSSHTVCLSLLSLLFCKDVGWSDLNLLIRPQRPGGWTLTSTIETCYHPICCEFATSSLHHLLFCPFFYSGPSIKAAFCSRGSYGASGLCHSPSSIIDQHQEE